MSVGRSAGAPMNSAPANHRGLTIPCASPFGLAALVDGSTAFGGQSHPKRRSHRARGCSRGVSIAPMNCRESNSEAKRKVVIAAGRLYR
jgi:hypothetical protein